MLAVERRKASRLFSARHVKCNNQTIHRRCRSVVQQPLQSLQLLPSPPHRHGTAAVADLDVETQLKMMDYFVSAPGSTEDLVGERRALSLESWDGTDRQALQEEIDRLIHQERIEII